MAADTWINPFAGLTRKHGIKCRSLDGVGIESYVQIISDTIGPKNIVAASRANGSVIIFLDSLKSVEEVCVVGMNDIGGTYISVEPLVQPATKVILSGVPPFIPNSVIEKELHRYGRVVSTIRIIPLGCKKPEFRHIKSFRRQVYMLGNEEPLQGVINFIFEERQYRVYLSTDEVTCYKCFKKGHIQRNCRLNIEQEQPAAGADQNNSNPDQNKITPDENTKRTDNNDKTTRKQTTNQNAPDSDQLSNTCQTHSNANETTETTSQSNDNTTDSTGVTVVDDSPMSIDASPDVEKTDTRTTTLNKEVSPSPSLSTPDINALCMTSQSSDSPTQSNAPHAGGSQNSETDDPQEEINITNENSELTKESINEERVLTPPLLPEASGGGLDPPCLPPDAPQEPAESPDDEMDESQSVVSDMSDISVVSLQDDISVVGGDLLSGESLKKFLHDSYNSRKLIQDATAFCPNLKLLIGSLTRMRKHSSNISSKEKIRMQRMTSRITKYYKTTKCCKPIKISKVLLNHD
jgi:hypothetical protein